MKSIRPDKTSRKAFKITKNVKKRYRSQFIPYEDYKHLNSITAKDYTIGVVK